MDGVDLFSAADARAARDEGLARVASHCDDFIALGLAVIATLPGGEYQGEDIRRALTARGLIPAAHQAWGALTRQAVAKNLLTPTGRYAATKSVKTHRHQTQIYER